MAKKTNWASAEHNSQDSSIVAGAQKSLNQEQWSEDFQDLSGYCNIGSKMVDNSALQLGEQLNTPNITEQDGFDFGLRSSSVGRLGALDDPDPWEALQPQSSPQSLTSNTKLWGSVSDWLMSTPHSDIDHDPPFDIIPEQDEKPPLIGPDGNYLLSQSNPEYDSLLPNMLTTTSDGQEYKEQSINIATFDTESQMNDTNNSVEQTFILPNIGSNSALIIKANENNNNYSSNNNNKSFPVRLSQPLVPRNQLKTEDACNYNKNRRDPATKTQLSSIFKFEEPILEEQVKEQSSFCRTADFSGGGNVIRRFPAVIVVPNKEPDVLLHSVEGLMGSVDELPVARQPAVKYVIPNIKSEPLDDREEMECISDDEDEPAAVTENSRVFKVPVSQMKKPALKLDIDSAANLIADTNAIASAAAVVGESLNTPDVLRPLLNNNNEGFDLLKYFEGGEETAGNLLGSGTDSPIFDIKRAITLMKTDIRTKETAEKILPDDGEETTSPTFEEDEEEEIIQLPTIKEEDEPSCSSSGSAPKRKQTSRTKKSTSKRRRTVSEDIDSDYNPMSDYHDDEDNDETFQPPSAIRQNKRQRTNSKSLYQTPPSKRTISSSEVDSDQESIASSADRYRELRDRNNQASRRSRMNRKSREQEMKEMADQLEQDNRTLKAKAESMEKLVKKLRAGLMKLVLSGRS